MLLEPEPHIPDVPDVSSIPEDVDIAGDVDVPAFDGVGIPGTGRVPGSTAVAGPEAPGVAPPPSYIALDPYICAGEVATVEHAVPLLVAGMEMVPAKPVGAGLTPADEISVEPNGIPVGDIVEPIVMPSGEVAPIVGVGMTEVLTCAIAWQTISAEKTAAITDNLAIVGLLKLVSPLPDVAVPTLIGLATSSPDAAPCDIGQSPVLWSMLTPEARGLPTRLAKFRTQTVVILLRSTASVSNS
jgi:hypothetical protein